MTEISTGLPVLPSEASRSNPPDHRSRLSLLKETAGILRREIREGKRRLIFFRRTQKPHAAI